MNSSYPCIFHQTLGEQAVTLIAQLDKHILDEDFRKALRTSLLQLSSLKVALDEASIVAVTDRKGIIQYVNDKFCEISKYRRDELMSKDHRIINSGYHSSEFMKGLWETISAGHVWRGEIRNRAKDGSYYWVNTTIVPISDDQGRPYQYLSVRNEVTELKQMQAELQRMMMQMMRIQEEERKRFSRELHDDIGQSLFSLTIQMDHELSIQPNPAIQKLRQQVTAIMADVRGLAWQLRPSVLDDLGVVPALRTYIDSYSNYYGIQVNFTCTLRKRLDIQKEIAIYRIVQEALTNIAKYADVAEATVTVTDQQSDVKIIIEDKGSGFILAQAGQGVGLFSMEERARGAGGQLQVLSATGSGTRIELSIPY